MDDEKEVRKKRRRSVRNLRRQSGVLPLNLSALDEGVDSGLAEDIQPDGNHQEMYGSMWCESQEPLVKKRRRRSGLIGVMAPKVMIPAIEENENNDSMNIAELSGKQIEMKSGKSTINNDTEMFESVETKLDTINTVAYCQTKDVQDTLATNVMEKTGKVEGSMAVVVKNALSPILSEVGECEDTNGINTSLNTSNISSGSSANSNMSKGSPDSMSPDFPLSPNTVIYQNPNEESFLGVSTKREEELVSDKNGMDTPLHSVDLWTDSVNEMKSPGADNVSDLSHSNKENSMISDNSHLDVTPKLIDESAEKVSPGFLSICKAFAGKVVNFVKTSPSFLTGALTDSTTASPALKGNTSLNQVPNEQSEPENTCDRVDGIGKERNHSESVLYAINGCESTGIEIDDKCEGQKRFVDMSIDENKSANLVIFGSAKKKRDRKSFIDTFNAVSNELKRDRRKSCSDDTSDIFKDKPVCPNFNETSEQVEDEMSNVSKKSKLGINIGKEVPAGGLLDNFIDKKIESDNYSADSVLSDMHVSGVDNTENIKSVALVSAEKCADTVHLQKDEQIFKSTGAVGLDYRTCAKDVGDNTCLIGAKKTAVSTSETMVTNMDINCIATHSKDVNNIIESQSEKVTGEEIVENIDRNQKEDNQRKPETICKNDRSQQKHNTKRQKRRAIVIPTAEDSETAFGVCAGGSENRNLQEKKQKLSSEMETDGQNQIRHPETEERKFIVESKSSVKADTRSDSNDKILISGKLQTKNKIKISIKKDGKKRSTTKTKKDRRKSFGFHSVSTSDKEVTYITERNSETRSFESEIKKDALEKEARLETDVEGPHEFCEKLNNRMESAVTVDGSSETAARGLLPNENMKKKRGRPRKSVNLQDLLKKGIPKIGFIDVVNTGTNENQNVSELTNEISQVQICDTNKEVGVLKNETSEERSVENVITGEQKCEPNLKCHISLEAESSNVQTSDYINSPSDTETSNTYHDKPRRQKNAPKKPRSNIIEKIIEEEDLVNSDGTENKNVSELTNEISQVKINDTVTEIKSVGTIENLILPDDHVTSQNQGREPKRKRRRSAEAASLKLQMIDLDESPSNSSVQDKPRRRKSADAAALKIQAGLSNQEESTPSPDWTSTVTKIGRKRKRMEESLEELEKIYRNKNFVKPEEKKPWQTVLESPDNSVEVFGKKRLQRHIEFERPTQMKLRRRLQRAVKNGWDPRKRKRSELADDFVQKKLENLWSELDQVEEDPNSLENKLKSIIETV